MHRIRQWRPSKGQLRIALIIIGIVLTFAAVVWLSLQIRWPTWTGFDIRPKDETMEPAKTLWDWMSLLIVPLVLTIGGFMYNRTEKKLDHERTEDNQREAALQAYLDKMSELLFKREPTHLR